LLGLSDIDPLRYNLLFERFCDPSNRWIPEFAFIVEPMHLEAMLSFVRRKLGGTLTREYTFFVNHLFRDVTFHYVLDVAPTPGEGHSGKFQFCFRAATPRNMVPSLVAKAIRREKDTSFNLDAIPVNDEITLASIHKGSRDMRIDGSICN
jgi:hypothetical protein